MAARTRAGRISTTPLDMTLTAVPSAPARAGATGRLGGPSYELLFKKQGGRCLVGVPHEEIFLDDSGHPRKLIPYYRLTDGHAVCLGLICTRCVTGLQMFGDSPVQLAGAIAFLTRPAFAVSDRRHEIRAPG